MSLPIEWKGRTVDVDPEEYSTLELGEVYKRTGLNYPELLLGVLSGNGDAVRALFWVVDRRDDPELKFDGYAGPPMRVWRELLPHFSVLSVELGKATVAAEAATATPGSRGSRSSTGSGRASTTG